MIPQVACVQRADLLPISVWFQRVGFWTEVDRTVLRKERLCIQRAVETSPAAFERGALGGFPLRGPEGLLALSERVAEPFLPFL